MKSRNPYPFKAENSLKQERSVQKKNLEKVANRTEKFKKVCVNKAHCTKE